MSASETPDLNKLFQTLKVYRKGSEDDFEVRVSEDEKIWAVRSFIDQPAKPTYIFYTGSDARDLACEFADIDLEDEDEDDEENDE